MGSTTNRRNGSTAHLVLFSLGDGLDIPFFFGCCFIIFYVYFCSNLDLAGISLIVSWRLAKWMNMGFYISENMSGNSLPGEGLMMFGSETSSF